MPRLELRIKVREVYGVKKMYPANAAAQAIADISGTLTLRATDLKRAKQHLGAIVVTEESDAAYVAALLDMI